MQILDGTPLRPGGKMLMSVTQAKFEQKGDVYSLTIHFLTYFTFFFFFTNYNSLFFNFVTTKRFLINLLFHLMNFHKQGTNLYPKK